jgi:hypothetical protein
VGFRGGFGVAVVARVVAAGEAQDEPAAGAADGGGDGVAEG